jgi:GNAT superfamily N-acetyltransferase
MSDYATRPLTTDAASLSAYRALFAETVGALGESYLHWLYVDNPRGAAFGFNAFAGDALAAHYATIPVAGELDGAPAKGLLSLNTATDRAHQGKGLFTRLAEQTYAHAADQGYAFVVGVANANSTPGFTKKLGFQLVSPLDVLVGAGRATPGDAPVAFECTYDDAALRWRLARPDAGYLGDASGLVYAPTHKAGILATMGVVPPDLTAALDRPRFTQPLRMWIGLDPDLRKKGVLAPLPDRLKPSPLNLIFRDLTGGKRQLARESTRFTLLDFDAY